MPETFSGSLEAVQTLVIALLPLMFAALLLGILVLIISVAFLFIDIKSTGERALDLYIRQNRKHLR